MNLSFRQKLSLISGVPVLALILLVIINYALYFEVRSHLFSVRERYIPLIDLGPSLQLHFEALKRGFQDATASQDMVALESLGTEKQAILEGLEGAKGYLPHEQLQELSAAMEEYFSTATTVSQRLIKNETGLSINEAIGELQERRKKASETLERVTNLDRGKLTKAFDSVDDVLTSTAALKLLTSFICIAIVLFLAFFLSRDLLTSLRKISDGFHRFGGGDFDHPIEVQGDDELAVLSRQANVMAERIRGLVNELEAFSYSVAHDLRAPLRSMLGFSQVLLDDHGDALSEDAKESVARISNATKRMGSLIDSLLGFSRVSRKQITKQKIDLSEIVNGVINDLQTSSPLRNVKLGIAQDVVVHGDAQLLAIVMTNLVGNAWKFTSQRTDARIEFGVDMRGPEPVYFVRDNGAGFDMKFANKLFGTFQRLHSSSEFEGTGIGLATVKNIINRHGGKIWAESVPAQGAAFFFTLG